MCIKSLEQNTDRDGARFRFPYFGMNSPTPMDSGGILVNLNTLEVEDVAFPVPAEEKIFVKKGMMLRTIGNRDLSVFSQECIHHLIHRTGQGSLIPVYFGIIHSFYTMYFLSIINVFFQVVILNVFLICL